MKSRRLPQWNYWSALTPTQCVWDISKFVEYLGSSWNNTVDKSEAVVTKSLFYQAILSIKNNLMFNKNNNNNKKVFYARKIFPCEIKWYLWA